MRTINNLKELLDNHVKWLQNANNGERANLSSTNLRYADLRYANLSYADLRYADLRYANLRYADLHYADLRYADLSATDLSYANLSSADLRYANLRYADLSATDLSYANLSSVDLSYAKGINWELYRTPLDILKFQNPKIKLFAFKFLNSNLTSPFEKFQYEIGKEYTTTDVDTDEINDCGKGFNLASMAWVLRNKNKDQVIVKCSFYASDIVAIPYLSDGKFRVSKMKVEKIVKEDK